MCTVCLEDMEGRGGQLWRIPSIVSLAYIPLYRMGEEGERGGGGSEEAGGK